MQKLIDSQKYNFPILALSHVKTVNLQVYENIMKSNRNSNMQSEFGFRGIQVENLIMNQDFREKFVAIMQNLKNSFDRILIKQIVPADLSFFCDFLDCSLHIGQDENLATVTVKRIFELNEIIFIKQLIYAQHSKGILYAVSLYNCSRNVEIRFSCKV